MNGQRNGLYSVKSILLSPLLSILLTGCGGSSAGGSDDAGNGSGSSNGGTNITENIPEAHVSLEDASVVVDAVARGVNPDLELLQTTFYCYYNLDGLSMPITDFSVPHATIDYVGTEFTLTGIAGDHTGTVLDNPNSNSVTFAFDTSIDDVKLRIEFDLFGQKLYDQPNDSELAGCYQQGASHERALHQFLLNTPELGVYECSVVTDGVVDTNTNLLTLLDANKYSYNGEIGEYRVGVLFENTASIIRFDTGALAASEGGYTESPNTGTQQFSVVSDVSESGASCTRQREPRPFKSFGAEEISPPPASSIPLTGNYYIDDGDINSVGWAVFSANGFINIEYAVPGVNSCQRTLPNGLAPCLQYTYHGGSTINLSGQAVQADLPITRFDDGSILIAPVGRYVPVNTPSVAELTGVWQIESASTFDAIDTSLCIIGFCGPTGISTKTLEFSADGRFIDSSSSQSLTSVNIPGLNVVSSGQSEALNSGDFQLEGAGLILQYDSGRNDPPVFVHLIDTNTLVVGYMVYRRA